MDQVSSFAFDFTNGHASGNEIFGMFVVFIGAFIFGCVYVMTELLLTNNNSITAQQLCFETGLLPSHLYQSISNHFSRILWIDTYTYLFYRLHISQLGKPCSTSS